MKLNSQEINNMTQPTEEERLELISEAVDKVQNNNQELNFDLELSKIEKELTGWE